MNKMKDLLKALQEASCRRNLPYYQVVYLENRTSIVSGNKDYCYGYYDALNSSKYVIVCENVIIYPEDRFGEVIDYIE